MNQDYVQMKNQYQENDLKRAILFNHTFNNEEPIMELQKMFHEYRYPNIEQIVELYNDYKINK